MDQKLVQLFLLGTLIVTASAWITSTRVYDIIPVTEFSPDLTYNDDPDEYGFRNYDVLEEECKAAGNFIRRATTMTDRTVPIMHGVKYQPRSHEYAIMYLADCGGGVYVKVVGNNKYHVYYT